MQVDKTHQRRRNVVDRFLVGHQLSWKRQQDTMLELSWRAWRNAWQDATRFRKTNRRELEWEPQATEEANEMPRKGVRASNPRTAASSSYMLPRPKHHRLSQRLCRLFGLAGPCELAGPGTLQSDQADKTDKMLQDLEQHQGMGLKERQPLAEQIAEARRQNAKAFLVAGDGVGEGQREVVAMPFVIQAAVGLPLPPALRCCIVTGLSTSASDGPVTLQRVRLENNGGPVLEVSEGTSCELYDCLVNGSVTLAKGASAKLIRTHVFGSAGSGVEGRAFAKLQLAACTVRDCVGDGLLLRHGEADISDCTITNCGQSGVVLGPGTWRLSGNVLSGNGQYGVWAEAGSKAVWGQSLCTGNRLGDRGGRGDLAGWQGCGLAPGEKCRVWSEKKGKWIKGEVKEVVSAQDEVVVEIRGHKAAINHPEPEPGVAEEATDHVARVKDPGKEAACDGGGCCTLDEAE
ncbi:unnamed protein product [Symbiodinium natans]|uniref:Right handed beta helix domain-containing protein n=1 Tax=Symbiodinium natans TaxID=878477 RepID=A0A812HK06_9DINO|nr:unnamed protein product [Symbiodinium natans]